MNQVPAPASAAIAVTLIDGVKVGERFAMDWPITSGKPNVPVRRPPDDAGVACVLFCGVLCCVLILGSLPIGESNLNAPRFLATPCNNIRRGFKKLHATRTRRPPRVSR